MAELEDLVAQQLKHVTAFQSDLDSSRLELTARMQDNENLTVLLVERDRVVENLKSDINESQSEREKLNKDIRVLRRTGSRQNRSEIKGGLGLGELDMGMGGGGGGGGYNDAGILDSPRGGYGGGGDVGGSGDDGADSFDFFDTRGKRSSVDSVGFDYHDNGGGGGGVDGLGARNRTVVAAPKRSFLLQLAETQKMLERVLEVRVAHMRGKESYAQSSTLTPLP